MTIAVLGAGAGGLSAVVELSLAHQDFILWNRRSETFAQNTPNSEIQYRGVLGEGSISLDKQITTNLKLVLSQADVLVICLPSVVHAQLFQELAELDCEIPIVLNPGHTGGALHLREVFKKARKTLPPVAEFSTLTYVARIDAEARVNITGRAKSVRVASLPGGRSALNWAKKLFPGADEVADVIVSSLSNVNLVLHAPGAILGAAWVEATSGNFTFYVDAMTPGVSRVMQALDDERLAVAKQFGHVLPSLIDEMAAIGTVDQNAALRGDLAAAIRGGVANAKISAPDSFSHRYYQEDLAFGLLPFVELAKLANVPVPVANALLLLGSTAVGGEILREGLTSKLLGLTNLSLETFIASVSN
ncbi:MAG: NAD/NADP octopine/nopaline dehydrogenase [Streptomycetaceae bacterium]|jgi:opine dehydrogenase|nr:MAG: NAD/NADP octopine/nopaline dehydrogenase [Streptomycetaceae bacterium]